MKLLWTLLLEAPGFYTISTLALNGLTVSLDVSLNLGDKNILPIETSETYSACSKNKEYDSGGISQLCFLNLKQVKEEFLSSIAEFIVFVW